jgi:signal transduction histidine kinase
MRKDGTAVDIELTGALTTYKDNRANVAYIRDITGRKKGELEIRRSEELYRGLFQNVPVAIAEDDYSQLKIYFDKLRANGVTDIRKFFTSAQNKPSNGKPWVQMTKVNDKALRLWDVTSVEEYINSFSQKHGDHIGIDGHTECLIGLAEGKTHFDYEELVRTVKGNWKHLHTWVSVAPGCEDSLSKVYICFIDITDRKNAENELKAYQDNLQNIINERTHQLSQEVEHRKAAENEVKALYHTERKLRRDLQLTTTKRMEFTRTLVHELKTPLTPLIVSSDFLVESLHEEPSLSFAKNIQLGAANLSKRILELLDMARGEVGVLKLSRKKVDSVELLRNTFDYVLPEANHSQLEMKLDIPEHLPAIMADAGRIQQVLLNLLNNAFKFTRRGGEVVLKASTEANNVIFEVQDTGCGIDGKDQKYLFKPYSKKKPQKDNLGGLGLGLTLSKMLVELHEGKYG